MTAFAFPFRLLLGVSIFQLIILIAAVVAVVVVVVLIFIVVAVVIGLLLIGQRLAGDGGQEKLKHFEPDQLLQLRLRGKEAICLRNSEKTKSGKPLQSRR